MELKKLLANLNQTEFARQLGITPRALSNYANGKRLTPLDVAHQIEKLSNRKVRTEHLEKTWRDKNG